VRFAKPILLTMQIKSIPWWLWLIPITLLLLATARLPYEQRLCGVSHMEFSRSAAGFWTLAQRSLSMAGFGFGREERAPCTETRSHQRNPNSQL
jgi:hypothetical protein